MNPMNRTLAWPSLSIIGPDKTNKGKPARPLTVMVIPISDWEAPKSCRNQKRNDSMYPQAVPEIIYSCYLNFTRIN